MNFLLNKMVQLITIPKPDTCLVFKRLFGYHLRLGHKLTIQQPDQSGIQKVTVVSCNEAKTGDIFYQSIPIR